MIEFSEFELENGLRVIHHQDITTPLVHVNILYNVGSRDENPEHTGLAHLFEHLMFSGSVNISEFDSAVQHAGGTNNAFTNTDITNYYITLPSQNIETALWLESDRMISLDFSEKNLNVQKGVVIEEFKQRYLNQPYGDMWLQLRPLVYEKYPYSWATIGKEIEHVQKTQLKDIKDFFSRFYNPSNAILCIAGNIGLEETEKLVNKWFSEIPAGEINKNSYTEETNSSFEKRKTITADVPQDMLVMAFRVKSRKDPSYYALDILSDLLGKSDSSRLYDELVRKKPLFSQLYSYVTGELGPGMFVIEGKLSPGINIEDAEKEIWGILEDIKQGNCSEAEFEKIKNKTETAHLFSLTSPLNIAMALCMGKNMGNSNLVNEESSYFQNVTRETAISLANEIWIKNNTNVLYYLANDRK
jgi:zinc protease